MQFGCPFEYGLLFICIFLSIWDHFFPAGIPSHTVPKLVKESSFLEEFEVMIEWTSSDYNFELQYFHKFHTRFPT